MNPLIDLHNRHIRYLRISITDRCNLRCRYCMPAGGISWVPHDQVLTYEEMLRILRICCSRGVEKVRITGGEPLLRKGIVDFIARANAIGGIRDLTLTTNGILLEALAPQLKAAGLRRVNVSLDTLDKEKFAYITQVDAFDKVIRGICAAHEHGLSPVKINAVAIRGFNDGEIADLARLTMALPVEVRFIELMPIGCITKYPEHENINAIEIKAAIEQEFGPLEMIERGLGPAWRYRIPGAKGNIGLIGALSERDFCGSCNRIRITAKGQLRPCLFSEEEVDLMGPMRRGVSDEDLEALIEEGVRRKPPRHGVCRGMDLLRDIPRARMSDIGG
ncbi:MAG TPA: GTP 3',8-cyclase MoaA [Deltaproteobacteria bacterium]|nr:GTP 3',8-cyclase MoaA [Deltaproteobacteria bacterium]HPR53915.1 GTP 3',8-cyclase MoaA [Deltaproteobacteria bacterium]HXK46715.1 GTP 3',8-cyclase MoaA [Deltaproteobacteria bacterium]